MKFMLVFLLFPFVSLVLFSTMISLYRPTLNLSISNYNLRRHKLGYARIFNTNFKIPVLLLHSNWMKKSSLINGFQ